MLLLSVFKHVIGQLQPIPTAHWLTLRSEHLKLVCTIQIQREDRLSEEENLLPQVSPT